MKASTVSRIYTPFLIITVTLLSIITSSADPNSIAPEPTTEWKKVDDNTVTKTITTFYLKNELQAEKDKLIAEKEQMIVDIEASFQTRVGVIDLKLEYFK